MKLAASQIAWQPQDEHRALQLLSQLGYVGLEIAPTRNFGPDPYEKPAEAAVFAGTVRGGYGLRLCSMQSIWFGLAGSMFGPERAFLLDYTMKAVAFAGAAGIPNLVFGCPKNRILPQDQSDEEAVSFFKAVGDAAAAKGTCFALEATPPIYGSNIMNTTPGAFEMARRVDSPGCKVNLDFGAMVENGESPDVIRGQGALINHVHISEPWLAPIERRDAHHALAEALAREGYDGYVSLEMKPPEQAVLDNPDAADDPLDKLETTLRYLSEVFG